MSPRIFLQGKIKSFQKVHFKSIKYFGLTIKCTNKKVQQDLVCLTKCTHPQEIPRFIWAKNTSL